MSVQFTIDASQKLVIRKFSGEISDADILENPRRVQADPQFDPSFSEVVDFSGVTGGDVSTSAIQELARQKSIFNLASKRVVIAPQPLLYGLTRMFEVYAEGTKPNIKLVHTFDEAREFLGLQKTS